MSDWEAGMLLGLMIAAVVACIGWCLGRVYEQDRHQPLRHELSRLRLLHGVWVQSPKERRVHPIPGSTVPSSTWTRRHHNGFPEPQRP